VSPFKVLQGLLLNIGLGFKVASETNAEVYSAAVRYKKFSVLALEHFATFDDSIKLLNVITPFKNKIFSHSFHSIRLKCFLSSMTIQSITLD
jgi:hypothetical protein